MGARKRSYNVANKQLKTVEEFPNRRLIMCDHNREVGRCETCKISSHNVCLPLVIIEINQMGGGAVAGWRREKINFRNFSM